MKVKTPIKTAVFPVGGLGTRFLPATKAMPKEMLIVLDKPLIQHAFEEAKAAGVEKFIFVTGRNKNIIENHFDHAFELQKTLEDKEKNEILALTKDWLPKAGSIAFVRQQAPLGLGHAVLCAKNFVNEPFAVLLADELFLSQKPVLGQMAEQYTGGNMVLVDEIQPHETGSYGIVKVDSQRKIQQMVEKPKPEDAPSNLAIVGRYILQPEIFAYLENQAAGAGGEVQLTDAIARLIANKNNGYAAQFDGQRFDCGGRSGFIKANIAFALADKNLGGEVREMLKTL
jgi:UTP-glucose-1-phosphate uridylyltransferase